MVAHAQPRTGAALSDGELRALIRESVRFLEEKNNKTLEYAYTLRNQRKQFDSAGKLKLNESVVQQRTFVDGVSVMRVLERNGKPLTPDEKKDNEDRIAARVAELKGMSPAQKDSARQKSRHEEWVRELPEALNYRLLGDDTVDGRRCWVLQATPNPGYRARNMQARVFEKMNGRFWIDQADRELVRAEAETFDSVAIGMGLLARVEKGTRFAIHRIKLPDGNWVVESQRLKFGARVMLVKWLSNEVEIRMFDFRHKSQLTASLR